MEMNVELQRLVEASKEEFNNHYGAGKEWHQDLAGFYSFMAMRMFFENKEEIKELSAQIEKLSRKK